jgi:DNA end-binding protein Ku
MDDMAARVTEKATIQFGLVTIPVALYVGARANTLSMNMLHDKDNARLKQQYICSECGEVVDRDHMNRGYEHKKGEYVVLKQSEIDKLQATAETKSMEIERFVPVAAIDPLYFEKSYLIGPDKGAAKPYRLLLAALERTGMCGIARYITHGRENIVVIRAARGGILMHTLFFEDEVRDFESIDLGSPDTKDAEVDLACQLVLQNAEGVDTFSMVEFHDEYRARALALIEAKVEKGEEIVAAPNAAGKSTVQVADVMTALRESLARGASANVTVKPRMAAKATKTAKGTKARKSA